MLLSTDDISIPTSRNKEKKTVEPSEPPLSPERYSNFLLIFDIPRKIPDSLPVDTS